MASMAFFYHNISLPLKLTLIRLTTECRVYQAPVIMQTGGAPADRRGTVLACTQELALCLAADAAQAEYYGIRGILLAEAMVSEIM
ncbi:uncharacterized protein ACO6RY_01752 [Pungitius sinensis]